MRALSEGRISCAINLKRRRDADGTHLDGARLTSWNLSQSVWSLALPGAERGPQVACVAAMGREL